MAEGVTGLEVAFRPSRAGGAAAEPHLVVVLNPAREPPAFAACRDPQAIGTLPAAETLKVFAAFCQGDRPLDAVKRRSGRRPDRSELPAPAPGAPRAPCSRTITRAATALASPRWLNLGVGGSFGLRLRPAGSVGLDLEQRPLGGGEVDVLVLPLRGQAVITAVSRST